MELFNFFQVPEQARNLWFSKSCKEILRSNEIRPRSLFHRQNGQHNFETCYGWVRPNTSELSANLVSSWTGYIESSEVVDHMSWNYKFLFRWLRHYLAPSWYHKTILVVDMQPAGLQDYFNATQLLWLIIWDCQLGPSVTALKKCWCYTFPSIALELSRRAHIYVINFVLKLYSF